MAAANGAHHEESMHPAITFPLPETCLFCFEDLGPDTPYRQLVCGHYFHSPCIAIWVNRASVTSKSNSCPLCRQILGPKPWSRGEYRATHLESPRQLRISSLWRDWWSPRTRKSPTR
ncbi:hypothetical protein BDQ94DRAFT_132360 [Aspergillus welwitschiae]|uniref:RING-type domain-containing protein n=1 Tax=Aspergillus welwitschiae TaxID=1341132 RepID=A0A3F3QK93_9EURO|nr:hypothetical protein BDQ94DRAFT_132360 [Aspergillus welwitschiae]RDH39096.1 hypothetical protein BDQ94DRAFT_132360 [Aspergillus welwitschiae]